MQALFLSFLHLSKKEGSLTCMSKAWSSCTIFSSFATAIVVCVDQIIYCFCSLLRLSFPANLALILLSVQRKIEITNYCGFVAAFMVLICSVQDNLV